MGFAYAGPPYHRIVGRQILMTLLLDSGYLEIGAKPRNDGDPVVAACFLRKKVRGKIAIHVALHHSGEFVLSDVRNLGWSSGIGDGDGNWWAYPIRISAATVAAVVQSGMFARLAMILGKSLQELVSWLDKYAGETWHGAHIPEKTR